MFSRQILEHPVQYLSYQRYVTCAWFLSLLISSHQSSQEDHLLFQLSRSKDIPYYGVKEAVFPFNMFPEVDPILGPEMRSTGEVLGLSTYYGEAFYKAQEATQTLLPTSGTVLISVNRKDKDEVIEIAQLFEKAGFKILATSGTYAIITVAGVKAEKVKKLQEGRPNINDLITNGSIDLIINSPSGKESAHDDSYLRKAPSRQRFLM